MPDQILDLRPLPPRDRHPLIFKALDLLNPGQAFQLINDHDPMPLYYQLQAQRPGQYAWAKAEDGPEVWRVDITRL